MRKNNLTSFQEQYINDTYKMLKRNWRDEYSKEYRLRYTLEELKLISNSEKEGKKHGYQF